MSIVAGIASVRNIPRMFERTSNNFYNKLIFCSDGTCVMIDTERKTYKKMSDLRVGQGGFFDDVPLRADVTSAVCREFLGIEDVTVCRMTYRGFCSKDLSMVPWFQDDVRLSFIGSVTPVSDRFNKNNRNSDSLVEGWSYMLVEPSNEGATPCWADFSSMELRYSDEHEGSKMYVKTFFSKIRGATGKHFSVV